MSNKYVNAMRSLALQTLANAKSGHPGMAMSSAPLTYCLYTQNINIQSTDPKWINRDRFVLSGGHGCLSIYTLLHFAGLISLDEMKLFRQGLDVVAGHPEYSNKNFIDASTGPLGQGTANAVGMAVAEKYLSRRWEKLKGLIDHYTYCVCGDGDLQEGISYEAMSIAGKLKLNKLVFLHDSNQFQLDSAVKDVNIESIKKRVESQGWHYLTCSNNLDEINRCIQLAKQSVDKPTLIEVKTIIGEGISAANSHKAHGFGINDSEIKHANEYYEMKYENFKFPKDIYDHFSQNIIKRGNKKYNEWNQLLNKYKIKFPEEVNLFLKHCNDDFSEYNDLLNIDSITQKNDATKTYLKHFFDQLKTTRDIITLSADLASTTNCKIGENSMNVDGISPYIMVGVREFSMAAIQNGILLHKGLKSICGTFLSFSDYLKSALRVGAISKLPSIYVLTHDTYKVGPDGPTHQPYDQIPMLRAIQNVEVLRPADEKETLACLKIALASKDQTYCLVLTRQALPSSYNTSIANTNLGAYVVHNAPDADITFIASGSELELAINSVQALKDTFNMTAKVVSCPCLKTFLSQDRKYIEKTLASHNGVISIEASSDKYWYELSNYCKKVRCVSATKFGKSMDGNKLYNDMGFNIDNIIEKCQELINEKNY